MEILADFVSTKVTIVRVKSIAGKSPKETMPTHVYISVIIVSECSSKCVGEPYVCLNGQCYCADGYLPNHFQSACVKCPGKPYFMKWLQYIRWKKKTLNVFINVISSPILLYHVTIPICLNITSNSISISSLRIIILLNKIRKELCLSVCLFVRCFVVSFW